MNMGDKKSGKIKVVYGCFVELDMAGCSIDRIRVALRDSIDIGVFLDGKLVTSGHTKVEAGQVLEFLHEGKRDWRGNCLQCSRGRGNVNVVYGAYDADMNLAGYTVAEVQAGLRDELRVDMDTPAYVDGRRVADKSQKVEAGQRLEFLPDTPRRRMANPRDNEAGGAAAGHVVGKKNGTGVGGMFHLSDAAEYIGMTGSGLRKLVDRKEIRYFQRKAHSPILFKSEWLDDYICCHTHDPKNDQPPDVPPRQKKQKVKTQDQPDDRHGFRCDWMRG